MKKALFLLIVCCVGCSKGVVPVTGRLVKGTEPVANVMISLCPEPANEGEIAHGGTDTQGNFTLYTLPHSGVLPGNYKIKLQPPVEGPATHQVPAALTDLNQTTWVVNIPPNGIVNLVLDVNKSELEAK